MNVQLEYLGGKNWKLVNQFTHQGKTDCFILPAGFETDLASVPRFLWWLIPPFDSRFIEAALIHDMLYRERVPAGTISRSDADGVFRRIMRLNGVPRLQRRLMWAAVRLSRLQGLRCKDRRLEPLFALAVGIPFLVLLLPVMIPVLIFSLVFYVMNILSGE